MEVGGSSKRSSISRKACGRALLNLAQIFQKGGLECGNEEEPNQYDAVASQAEEHQRSPKQLCRKLSTYLDPGLAMAMHQHGRVPEEMYEWQAECLSQQQGSVLEGETNLVFSAPTSAGKTLVAEILMLRALSRDPKRKTLLVLPYVALCREKAERLQSLVAPLDRQVREAHGGSASKRTGILAPSTGIIVATIENANSLINRLLESSVKLSDEFSCVVVDELHMLGDGDRGYLLELLLNKFLYQEALGLRESLNDNASPAYPSFSSIKGCTEAGTLEMSNLSFSFLHQTASVQPNRKVQLVGMSATLPNLETIAHWLSAACYQTTFRPVPLYEYIKCENELLCLDSKTQELCIARKLPPPSYQGDDEHITELVKEVSDAGHSCLVFCATKKSCEVEATRLARQLGNVEEGEDNSGEGKGGSEVTEIEEWVAELQGTKMAQSVRLAALLKAGMAYHTADLTRREREIVESAFRSGKLRALCATSTLAAGVNLPARRVIFKDAYVAIPERKNWLSPSRYRQMAGRAGRAGIDSEGDAILIWSSRAGIPMEHLKLLLKGHMEPVRSALCAPHGLRQAMLEIIASGAAARDKDVSLYVGSTLPMVMASTSEERTAIVSCTRQALASLGAGGPQTALIKWDGSTSEYSPTQLGSAILASGIPLEEAVLMSADLKRARDTFVMSSELYSCYLCVPTHIEIVLDRTLYSRLYRKLQEIHRLGGPDCRAATAIGVDMGFVFSRQRGSGKIVNPPSTHSLHSRGGHALERTCRRFYAACILLELIQETSPSACMELYGVKAVLVESLQEASARFASKARSFCMAMGWQDMAGVLDTFGSRIERGAKPEIMSLTRLKGVEKYTARLLYAYGLTDPKKIVKAGERGVLEVLLKTSKTTSVKGLSPQSKKKEMAILLARARTVFESATVLVDKDSELGRIQDPGGAVDECKHKSGGTAWMEKVISKEGKKLKRTLDAIRATGRCGAFLGPLPDCGPEFGVKSRNGDVMTEKGLVLVWTANDRKSRKDSVKTTNRLRRQASEIRLFSTIIPLIEGTDTDSKQLLIKFLTDRDKEKTLIIWTNIKKTCMEGLLRFCQRWGESECRLDWKRMVDVGVVCWMLNAEELKDEAVVDNDDSAFDDGNVVWERYKDGSPPPAALKAWQALQKGSRAYDGLCALDERLVQAMHNTELAVMGCVVEMEAGGVGIKPGVLERTMETLKERIKEVNKAVNSMIGHDRAVDLKSHAQVRDLLYKRLELKPNPRAARTRKRKNGDTETYYSSDKEALLCLADSHPVVPLILEHRKLIDLHSTADELLATAKKRNGGFDGHFEENSVIVVNGKIIHPASATGRIAMENPNLQCLHKPHAMANLRAAVVPPNPGRLLLSADFCQMEFRMMAHFSGDQVLCGLLRDQCSDPFRLVAARWHSLDPSQVTDELRQNVKGIVYALCYGMGSISMSERVGVSPRTAKEMKDGFLATFEGLKLWLGNVVDECTKVGYVQTLHGRRRYLPDIVSADKNRRAVASRVAVNTVCQGSAADVAKAAMIAVEAGLREKGLHYNAALMLHIHDELVLEVDPECLRDVASVVKERMENAAPLLSVPLNVKLSVGANWGELKPYSVVKQE